MAYGEPGTLIHGTMREEDLIPCFSDELARLCNRSARACFHKHTKLIEEAGAVDYDTETATELCVELFDALNEHAPAKHYFGAHPGDGSDYGFWEVENGDDAR